MGKIRIKLTKTGVQNAGGALISGANLALQVVDVATRIRTARQIEKQQQLANRIQRGVVIGDVAWRLLQTLVKPKT